MTFLPAAFCTLLKQMDVTCFFRIINLTNDKHPKISDYFSTKVTWKSRAIFSPEKYLQILHSSECLVEFFCFFVLQNVENVSRISEPERTQFMRVKHSDNEIDAITKRKKFSFISFEIKTILFSLNFDQDISCIKFSTNFKRKYL